MGNGAKGKSGSRSGRPGGGGDWKSSRLVWAGAALVLVALLVFPAMSLGGSTHHPEPREHIDHTHVAPAERYAAYPRVAQIYGEVAEVPHVIDGIYCYCACSEHSGHHSLLDCFHDDHAAHCDVCLSEATMAHRMHSDGKSLDEIRTAIDRIYDTGPGR
jgi:hypothetical protein